MTPIIFPEKKQWNSAVWQKRSCLLYIEFHKVELLDRLKEASGKEIKKKMLYFQIYRRGELIS